MEDFEAIKQFTYKTIVENKPAATMIKDWKDEIRNCLQKVKSDFIEWID